jgi:chromosome segregation ATPase
MAVIVVGIYIGVLKHEISALEKENLQLKVDIQIARSNEVVLKNQIDRQNLLITQFEQESARFKEQLKESEAEMERISAMTIEQDRIETEDAETAVDWLKWKTV